MLLKELTNIKDKNSQEILLYLQRKNIINKNTPFFEELKPKNRSKNKENDNKEILPPSRMKQFINNSFITKNNNNHQNLSSNISKETKELTIINTPKFTKMNISKENNIYKYGKNISCNSHFSFSEKDDINEKSVNYLNYNLHENIETTKCKKEEIRHIYLPKKYKDDEEYKSNLYKYLKADNKKNNMRERGNKTKILKDIKNNYDNISKKRKSFSVKKRELNKIVFFDKNIESSFNLYKDDNIGIEKGWQLPIIYQKYDNDIDSDEEQINKGKEKMLYDLRIAIIKWSHNKKICYNYRYLDKPIIHENEVVKKYSISL